MYYIIIQTKLNRDLQKEIDKITEYYDKLKTTEHNRIDNYFNEKRTDVNNYYEQEIKSLDTIIESIKKDLNKQYDKEYNHNVELSNNILSINTILSLLVLCDELDADKLRKHCLSRIKENIKDLRQDPEWSNSFLSDATV